MSLQEDRSYSEELLRIKQQAREGYLYFKHADNFTEDFVNMNMKMWLENYLNCRKQLAGLGRGPSR